LPSAEEGLKVFSVNRLPSASVPNLGKSPNKTRVLVVEDEVPLAMLMVHVLTRVGCDVEAAHSGKKAMELATERTFDLIALDIELPDISGFEICSELKQRHISRKTPVIFISANPCQENMAEGRKRGAADYITKPFDMTDFIHRVIFHAKAKPQEKLDAI
jgi:DNA-binding response OmpR family regulator